MTQRPMKHACMTADVTRAIGERSDAVLRTAVGDMARADM